MVKNPVSPGSGGTLKYEDIIYMTYPLENHDNIKHPRMPVADRAKIFSPFSALKGYDDAIARKQREVEDEERNNLHSC
jgi:hypothetical protein